jgi:hypothetical protein
VSGRQEEMRFLTRDSLKDPDVRKAASDLWSSDPFDVSDTERVRNILVELLEPDDFDGYEELQREIDEVFYGELL